MFRLFFIVCVVVCTACSTASKQAVDKYSAGVEAWEDNKREEAIQFLTEAVNDSPDYYDAHVKLGEYHAATGNYNVAISELERAFELQDGSAELHILLGEAYLGELGESHPQQEKYLKPQSQFTKALRKKLTDEQMFRAQLGKGICKLEQNLAEDAEEYLEKAHELAPKNLQTLFYIGRLRELQMNGPNKKSLANYRQIIAEDPKHLGALKRMGNIYNQLGLVKKALEYYQDFLKAGGKSKKIRKYVSTQVKKKEEAKEPEAKKEVVMVCPECERFFKPEEKECQFDGELLQPQE